MYSIRRSRLVVGCLGILGAVGCPGTTAENAVGAGAQLKSGANESERFDHATTSAEPGPSVDETAPDTWRDELEASAEDAPPELTAAEIELDCSTGEGVSAAFGCDSVLTSSCKDLSNVVLEFADGERQRFEGLSGYSSAFAGTAQNTGKVIVRVWIKSGANHSGEGPGYGTRFDAPESNCAESEGSPEPDLNPEPQPEPEIEPQPTPEPESGSEHCGEVPDEYCSEPTPPPVPCDPENPESECYFPAPE